MKRAGILMIVFCMAVVFGGQLLAEGRIRKESSKQYKKTDSRTGTVLIQGKYQGRAALDADQHPLPAMRPVGKWTWYYKNGNIKEEGFYHNVKRQRLWRSWYENGSLKQACSWHEGVREGHCVHYHSSGQIASRGYMRNGKKTGQWEYFYSGGAKKKIVCFYNGIQVGKVISYHKNGRTKSVRYFNKQGKPVGEVQCWYADGKPRLREFYENGVANGPRETWHDNGTRASVAFYMHGKRHGRWAKWDKQGKVVRVRYYRQDKLLTTAPREMVDMNVPGQPRR